MRSHSPSSEAEALYRSAQRAAERAYAPYSDFRVGAAILTESGETVTAGNIENASFSVTICAERAAVARAAAEGHIRFAAIAVAGPSDSVSPCGACRQVLSEFATDDMAVTFSWKGELVTMPLKELLPRSFELPSS